MSWKSFLGKRRRVQCGSGKFIYPADAFVPQFAFLALKSNFFQARLTAATRSAQAGFNKGDLAAIDFPLPPLAEQNRIVAKVDELMALCDRLESAQRERESRRDKLAAASLHRLNNGANADEFREHARFQVHHLRRLATRPEHIQQLRQTILNLAVRGKLVPQDPNEESIHERFRDALERRGALVRTRKVRHKHFDEYAGLEKPIDLPDHWTVERLGNLVDPEKAISYGVLVPGNDIPNGVPFVRAQDLTLSAHPSARTDNFSRRREGICANTFARW